MRNLLDIYQFTFMINIILDLHTDPYFWFIKTINMQYDAKLLKESLLNIWNDRDAVARRKVMQEIYAADITFYENNQAAAITGHEAINELIEQLQKDWPVEFSFQLTGPAQINHEVQHIAWTLGTPGAPPAASGMDIAMIKNDKIQSLYLFLNSPAQ